MATQIQIRRDTSTNWTANNPTVSEGEVAYETDTRKLKIGDGATAWTTLPYFTGTGGVTDVLGGAGLTASGVGVVTLDIGSGTGITVNADDIAVDMTAFSTTDLSEGTNLYYTDARVAAAVTANAQKLQQFSETVNVVGNTSGAVSLDCATGSIFDITLIGDVTSLALTNVAIGTSATIIVRQDASGSRLLTAGASWLFAGGTNTLSTPGLSVDIISVVWNGTNYFASLTTDYS